MKKIVICGGHLTPAIAIVERLQKEKNYEIFYVTRKHVTEGNKTVSAEYTQIQKYKVNIKTIAGGKIQRHLTIYTLVALLKIPVSLIQAFIYLLKVKPDAAIVVGGPISFPVVFSAWLLGIPSIVHEQATIPGLSNQLNAFFAKKIFITWPKSEDYFPQDKTQLIGNLVRKPTGTPDRRIVNFTKKGNVLLVTGGNQGSHFLNNLVFESQDVLRDYKVVHILGTANFNNDHKKALKLKNDNYLSAVYLSTASMEHVFSQAKIVLSRSGANTVWDLAAHANVSVLVPLPISASDEQLENAKILEDAGCTVIVSQTMLNKETLQITLKEVEKNYTKLKRNAKLFEKSLPSSGLNHLANYIKRSL